MTRSMKLLAALVFLGMFVPASSASITAKMWSPNDLPVISDSNSFRAVFAPLTFTSINDDYSFAVNNSYKDFQAVLVPCSQAQTIDPNYRVCITSVQYRTVGTVNWSAATLGPIQLSNTPTTTIAKTGLPKDFLNVGPFSSDQSLFRPEGGIASVWDMSKAIHDGSSTYLLRARISSPGADKTSSVDGGLQNLFKLELIPVDFPKTGSTFTQDQYQIQNFPKGIEYRVRIQFGVYIKSLSGWYFNRLQNPSFDSNAPLGYLDVAGLPAFIPAGVTQVLKNSEVPSAVTNCPVDSYCGSTSLINSRYAPFDSEERINPNILAAFEAVPGGVKTVATISQWGLDSTRLSEVTSTSQESQDCLFALHGKGARVFLGTVSSNASLFQTTPPTWNSSDKSFSFKVAAPHLDENGKPNLGYYTLMIPIEQAVCRWGDQVQNPVAQIEVVNQDGTTKITTASAQTEFGLLKFQISGFGYSNPTIRIKLGGKLSDPQPTEAPKKPIAAIPSATIICTKGKVVKKITALHPTCPIGFKKK